LDFRGLKKSTGIFSLLFGDENDLFISLGNIAVSNNGIRTNNS